MGNGFYQSSVFVEQLDFTDLSIIMELGAGRGVDTVELFDFYEPSVLYTFEADPVNWSKMQEYLKNFDLKGRVKGFNVVVSNIVGPMSFWRHPDFRNSSILKPPFGECEQITVNSITIDAFCQQMQIPKIDLILSDIQGAEILAFLGQKILTTVQYIICQAGINPSWKPKYPLIGDLEGLLVGYGLKKIKEFAVNGGMTGNYLFSRKEE